MNKRAISTLMIVMAALALCVAANESLSFSSLRDLVSLWTTENNLTVTFADNPNGDGRYEAEIAFDVKE